ncbi:MAG: ribosomal protein S18-alanine N-acetyltransferase [Chloroflexi bacterium]|nr:ribosomal protein S18-alanine N-acetyltransferase [Chloroflexota bacterium]
MRIEHIPVVSAIERRCFAQPWPQNAYRREIQTNKSAHYFVVRLVEPNSSAPMVEAPKPAGSEPGLFVRLSRMLRGPTEPTPSPALESELRSIVGYAGLWLMTDEAHITTIAVDPDFQGNGLGELLLVSLIDCAKQIGARWLTLEVRVSNDVAQRLYEKYTFKEMGLRRRYYSDNNEDALVMWTDPIDSDTFRDTLQRNRDALTRRLGLYD